MAKPYVHADSSVRKWGGKRDDYLPIHDFMDSSKSVIADGRHRLLTHNAWFISNVIERVFGHTIVNSAGREVSTRLIAELHVAEDYGGYIPTAHDFLEVIPMLDWMHNGKGEPPPSQREIVKRNREKSRQSRSEKRQLEHENMETTA